MAKGVPGRPWYRRKWPLVLASLLTIVLVVCVGVLVLMGHNDATKLALATASANSALVDRLGLPIQPGWFIRGSIEVTPDFGQAELAIPVSGPKGKGTIYALAEKTAGVWKLTFLQFGRNDDPMRIPLLP